MNPPKRKSCRLIYQAGSANLHATLNERFNARRTVRAAYPVATRQSKRTTDSSKLDTPCCANTLIIFYADLKLNGRQPFGAQQGIKFPITDYQGSFV
jgi:hypothetical protein